MEHSKFLYSAVYGFDNDAVMRFFEEAGCPLKTERGQRVFPKSDHSSDIIKVLEQRLKRLEVNVLLDTEIKEIHVKELLENSQEENKDSDQNKKTKKKGNYRSQVASVELFYKKQVKNSKECRPSNYCYGWVFLCAYRIDRGRVPIC